MAFIKCQYTNDYLLTEYARNLCWKPQTTMLQKFPIWLDMKIHYISAAASGNTETVWRFAVTVSETTVAERKKTIVRKNSVFLMIIFFTH